MYRLLPLIALTLLVSGLCFVIGIYLAKRFARKKREGRKLHAHSLPMSAFSTLDHPAAASSEELTPFEEAEIFLTYGKKQKALEVLRVALARKRITREEYEAFKARNDIE